MKKQLAIVYTCTYAEKLSQCLNEQVEQKFIAKKTMKFDTQLCCLIAYIVNRELYGIAKTLL